MAAKTKTPFAPTAEFFAELTRAIADSAEPLTAAELSKRLPAEHRVPPARLEQILEQQVAHGALQRHPPKTAKGKPRYWDRDLRGILRSAVLQAIVLCEGPIAAKDLAGLLPAPPKFTEGDVATMLTELTSAGSLFEFPPKGKSKVPKPRYWNHDRVELARREVSTAAAAKGPRKRDQLRQVAVLLDDRQFDQILEELLRTRRLFLHPPLKAGGPPLYGGHPAVVRPYLHEVESKLKQVVGRLTSAGVSRDELRRTLVEVLEDAGIPFGAGRGRADGESTGDGGSLDLVALMKQIEPAAERGALVGAAELRRAARVEKDVFDRAALTLARQGRISLHRHDFAVSLTPEQRDELVTDGAGTYYVGMAIRRGDG